MSQWRAFNASGRNRTCLWCGRELRKEMRMVYDDEIKRAYGLTHRRAGRVRPLDQLPSLLTDGVSP